MFNKHVALAVIAFITAFLVHLPAGAKTLIVTSALDPSDPGKLTLREAIDQAIPGDTICFDSSLNGATIVLKEGTLRIQKSLTVTTAGLNQGITVDGNQGSFAAISAFEFTGSGNVELIGLTITHAGGGGVHKWRNGSLGLTDCKLIANKYAGIDAESGYSLKLLRTTVADTTKLNLSSCAGVCSQCETSIVDCTISNNDTVGLACTANLTLLRTVIEKNSGGGITVASPEATIADCDICENQRLEQSMGSAGINIYGGARYTIARTRIADNITDSYGGGIYSGSSSIILALNSCNVLNNSAERGGGIYFEKGEHTITNCTIAKNTAHGNFSLWNAAGICINNCDRPVKISNSRICNNIAQIIPNSSIVGGIGNFFSNTTICNCKISDNIGIGVGQIEFFDSKYPLVVNDSQICGNKDGGVYAAGQSLTKMSRCVISGNSTANDFWAGGIINSGAEVILENSTISNNRAPRYAATLNSMVSGGYNGTTRLSYCTVSGNQAKSGDGGGVCGVNTGTGLIISLNNCTVSGNQAVSGKGGGVYLDGGGSPSHLSLLACTVTNNQANGVQGGGGVYIKPAPTAIAELNNTIVAGNSDGQDFAPDVSGSIKSFGYNLIGKVDGSTGWIETDQTGDASDPLDPFLGPLADNGGPTKTHALRNGSIAINTGNPRLAGTQDQRGRIRDKAPDIGSYEATR